MRKKLKILAASNIFSMHIFTAIKKNVDYSYNSIEHPLSEDIMNIRGLLEKWIHSFTGASRVLSSQFNITNKCNLRCKHCYISQHSDDAIPLDDWKKILDEYSELMRILGKRPAICISGGEPFCSPILFDFLKAIEDRWSGCSVLILTNGTLLSSELIERLKQLQLDLAFQISIDGTTAQEHDSVRGYGSFEKSLAGTKLLLDAKLPIYWQGILSKRTAPQIGKFFDLALANSVTTMSFVRLVASGTAKKLTDSGQDMPLLKEDLKSAMLNILEHAKRTKIQTDTAVPLFCLVDSRHGGYDYFGFGGVIVDHLGRLLVSSRTDVPLGYVLIDGLKKLYLDHPLMKALRVRSNFKCGSCKHFENCGGSRNAAYAAFGSFFAEDPACWLNQTNTKGE